jgi:hypothetical protein
MTASAMNLQIRDKKTRELAQRIAERRNICLTAAVLEALQAEYERASGTQSLAERAGAIADELAALAGPGGREMGQAQIDEMWGG